MALFEKKEKAKYEPIMALIGQGDDYHIYNMTFQDRLIAGVLGGGGGAFVAFLFFSNIFVAIIAAVGAGYVAQGIYMNSKLEKRKKNLLLQFKDLLESLTSSYATGKNTLDSFTDAYGDLEQVYGAQADITQEVAIIVAGMNNNINVEDLLTNFAQRSGLGDIASFADVFRVSMRQGANIKDIIASTRDVINDKIEIELEIETMLTGNKNELNVMMVMPLLIFVAMSGLGGEMSIKSNTPVTIIVKIVVLGIFALAYALGRKITNIKI